MIYCYEQFRTQHAALLCDGNGKIEGSLDYFRCQQCNEPRAYDDPEADPADGPVNVWKRGNKVLCTSCGNSTTDTPLVCQEGIVSRLDKPPDSPLQAGEFI